MICAIDPAAQPDMYRPNECYRTLLDAAARDAEEHAHLQLFDLRLEVFLKTLPLFFLLV